MTRHQIAESLDLHINYVNLAFETAIKEHPELDIYDCTKNNKKGNGADYTLEQILLAMSYLRDGKGLTELERIILEEDFSMRPVEKVKAKGIEGTEEFLQKVANYPKKKCCSTCAYCTKAAMRNRKPVMKPFCNFWSRFLHRMKNNKGMTPSPYNDWCNQWEYSGKEPLIFYTHDSPVNLDIYGNVKNEVMGYDVSKFSKDNKEGALVTDVGIETIPDFGD